MEIKGGDCSSCFCSGDCEKVVMHLLFPPEVFFIWFWIFSRCIAWSLVISVPLAVEIRSHCLGKRVKSLWCELSRRILAVKPSLFSSFPHTRHDSSMNHAYDLKPDMTDITTGTRSKLPDLFTYLSDFQMRVYPS